ncbi:hypothetical protein EV182_007931, partial [Spiromyces aspiralis]
QRGKGDSDKGNDNDGEESKKRVTESNLSFVTDGEDHRLLLWDVRISEGRDRYGVRTSVVKPAVMPSYHTSSVYAIKYSPYSNQLLSGGADNRLQILDLTSRHIRTSVKYDQQIKDIILHPQNPNLALIHFICKSKHFSLVDLRVKMGLMPKHVVKFGYPAKKNQSRYLKSGMRADGTMVACGLHDTSEGDG